MTLNMNIGQAIALFTRIAADLPLVEHSALERAAVLIENDAKASVGEYQVAAGPFVEWARLADATKADRVAKGFPEDEPELRTGALRDSIQHQTGTHEAHVGSDALVMVYQELGTAKMPPRSILGGAAVRKADEVRDLVGDAVVAHIAGKRAI